MCTCQDTFVYKIEAFGVADDDAYWSCLDWWSHECQSQVWSIRSTFCKSECAGELYFHFQSNISDNIHWCGLKLVIYTQYTLCSICEGERRDCNLHFIGCIGLQWIYGTWWSMLIVTNLSLMYHSDVSPSSFICLPSFLHPLSADFCGYLCCSLQTSHTFHKECSILITGLVTYLIIYFCACYYISAGYFCLMNFCQFYGLGV